MSNMYFITLLVIAFVLALSNAQPPNSPTSFANSDCVCTLEYNPQCGVDGRTYSNPCSARVCAGVEIAYPGRCEDCICTAEYNPQCGVDGRTYSNPCIATRCAGVTIAYPGRCEDCVCTIEYNPQCGVDGRTYSNPCVATRCYGVEIAYPGRCEDCICPRNIAPVCGINGRTYLNDCIRRCSGIPKAYDGPCIGGGRGGCPNEFCFVHPCRFARCRGFPRAVCRKGCGCRPRFFIGRIEVTHLCRRRIRRRI